jgi:hypothetical protein
MTNGREDRQKKELHDAISNDLRRCTYGQRETEQQCFSYLSMDEVWSLRTKCMVLRQSSSDGVPDVARNGGLSYALQISAVNDVVANARQQPSTATQAHLLEAFPEALAEFLHPGGLKHSELSRVPLVQKGHVTIHVCQNLRPFGLYFSCGLCRLPEVSPSLHAGLTATR